MEVDDFVPFESSSHDIEDADTDSAFFDKEDCCKLENCVLEAVQP